MRGKSHFLVLSLERIAQNQPPIRLLHAILSRMSAPHKQRPTMCTGPRGEEVGRQWLKEHAASAGYGPSSPVVLIDREIPAVKPQSGNPTLYLTFAYAKKPLPEEPEARDPLAEGSFENGDDRSEKEPARGIPTAHQGDDSSTHCDREVPSYLNPPDDLSFFTTHRQGFEELCSQEEGLGTTDYINSIVTKFDEVSEPSNGTGSTVTKWYSTVPVSSSDQVPSQ
jgi:hypothetical protein